jgi:hypothetical protein
LTLAVVRDLCEARAQAGPKELAALEADVIAGLVLARSAAGLSDATITSDVVNLEQIRVWFGRPLREMKRADADAYFGTVLRSAAKGTRIAENCSAVPTARPDRYLATSPNHSRPAQITLSSARDVSKDRALPPSGDSGKYRATSRP